MTKHLDLPGRSRFSTRVLPDALSEVNQVLEQRGTCLAPHKEWHDLAARFSPLPDRRFFRSWAFTAAEYDAACAAVRIRNPELAQRLEPPEDDRDFTLVGDCSLDLRFLADINGISEVPLRLADGVTVSGGRVQSRSALLYANGLVALPAAQGSGKYAPHGVPEGGVDWVYLLRAEDLGPGDDPAGMAATAYAGRGAVQHEGLSVIFPQAESRNVADTPWVLDLESPDGLYRVRKFLSEGHAVIDRNGFFVRETRVVQMMALCITEPPREIVLDGPFLAFFADAEGIHAAAWFDRDAFFPA